MTKIRMTVLALGPAPHPDAHGRHGGGQSGGEIPAVDEEERRLSAQERKEPNEAGHISESQRRKENCSE